MGITASVAAGQAYQQATTVQRGAGSLAQARRADPFGSEAAGNTAERASRGVSVSQDLMPPPSESGRGQYLDIQV